jgi:hypothetical protein
LVSSRDRSWPAGTARRGVADETVIQLDLFLDARDVILANEVTASLIARDARAVSEALDRLREANPQHPDLTGLARLQTVLQTPPAAVNRVGLLASIDEAERSLVPLAGRLLGARAAAFLRPLWRALAEAAVSLPFDDAHPRAHRAWLCQQCEDWGAVAAAVVSVPGWSEKVLLRYWLGLARDHLGEPEAALKLWLPLCWLDPQLFTAHAPTLPSLTVRQAWEAFERASALDDLVDGPDRTPWFPAWMLLRHRGLAPLFDAQEIPDTVTAARVFRRLLVLLPLERGVLSDELIRHRRALQQVSPRFFRYYLDVVGQRRPGA